ncbi:hypothetical protein GCM10010471_02450 [Leucobacter komagatae]
MNVEDSAGMTRAEVSALSAEERFDLYGERYERARELMTDAQLQLSTGSWKWLTGGVGGPWSGPSAAYPFPGADSRNSYFIDLTRTIHPEGAVGAREDAVPMIEYFESQGWEASLIDVEDRTGLGPHRFEARAVTEDGFRMVYQVQDNGQYNLSVMSGLFWADQSELSDDIDYRIPKGSFFPPGEESVPGVYVDFPKWSDPKLRGPDQEGKRG